MANQAIDDFLAESEELLEKLNQDLAVLGDSVDTDQADPDLLNGIFRDAHSIKGLAGMFGFDDVAELAHHLENLLDHLRLGKIFLSDTLIDCLFDSLEGLAGLIGAKADNPDSTQDISSYLARIEHLLSGPPEASTNPLAELNIDPSLLEVLTEYEEHRLQENLKNGKSLYLVKVAFSLLSFDTELAELTGLLKQNGEVISTLPGTENDNPELLAFRLLVGASFGVDVLMSKLAVKGLEIDVVIDGGNHSIAKQSTASKATSVSLPTEIESLTHDTSELPHAEPVSASAIEASDTENGGSARSLTSTVRVDIGKLDNLMALVGELALAKGTIAQLCGEIKSTDSPVARELEKAVHILGRRLNELQSGVMDVRMVPVRQLFDKMNRIIRRMAQELGKKVQLEIRGGDTELDKLIVEDLTDPLMHIIRNALDHGIESPERRRAFGKPEVGTISLVAAQKGNHVVIEIHDDGSGIDLDMLRRKGVEKGMISAESSLSRQELFGLLFQPGFSTRAEISEYSGRGVGMDVVKNNISALSGMIDLTSEVGRGTTMSLTLPITLAVIKALVVRIKETEYAIPLNSVLETLMLEAGMIQTIEGREVMELRHQALPLLRLDKIFQLPGGNAPQSQFVVVAGFGEKRIGIVVDELCGQQDVVIKSLGKALSFIRGIAGAADLGSQKTILVLDVSSLIGESPPREEIVGTQ